MKIQDWTTGGKSADVGGKPMQGQAKVRKVMQEFKSGKLKSSSGQKVTNPKQAVAIGLSEAGLSRKKESEMKSKKYAGGGMSNAGGATRGLERAAAMSGRTMPTTGRSTGMKSGGLAAGHKSADGVAKKGKTKAKQIAMRGGGKC